MTKKQTGWFMGLLLAISLLGCTSNLTYTATQPSSSLIEEVAKAANVDANLLKQSVTTFIANGGLLSLENITSPEQFPILACVADTYHDGVLNLRDVQAFAGNFEQTCSEIAQEAQDDADIDDNIACPNLHRDDDHQINLLDLDVFIELYRTRPEFSADLCNNIEAADNDGLSTYTEAFAWLNTDPFDPNTFGIPDLEYYQGIVDPSDSDPDCGNGVIDGEEECDGADFGNETCQSQGFDGGTLTCTNSCEYYTSGCFLTGGAQRIAYTDFESESWRSQFLWPGDWAEHATTTTHDPYAGSLSLRWNQFEGLEDPITHLPGRGNPNLEWRGGIDLVSPSPNGGFFRMAFRHDDYSNDTPPAARKLGYIIDDYYAAHGSGYEGLYISRQFGNQGIKLSGNAGVPDHLCSAIWGYSSMYLSNPNVSPGLNGEWVIFSLYIDYNENYAQIWINGHIMYPQNAFYVENYPELAAAGKILLIDHPHTDAWRMRGFDMMYFDSSRDCVNCSDQDEFYAGVQVDNIEFWNGRPGGMDLR